MQLCKLYLTNVERAYDCKNSYQFILLLGTIWDSIWPVHMTGLQTIWSLLSLNHIIFFLKSISNMHAFCLRHSRTCSLHWFTGSCSPYHEIWNLINPVFFYRKHQACSVLPLLPFSLVIPFSRATPFIPNCKAFQLSWRVKPFEVWSKL